MRVIFQFPGQSSRYPGMVPTIARRTSRGADTLARACAVLGRDLFEHFDADNPHAYRRNRDIQLGVFLANHLFLELVHAEGICADASLGLSLGEWNHLVHIGAVSFDDAVRAVSARGEAYERGPRGTMVAVFPITADELQEFADRARGDDVLEIVNLNSPRQQVLAGDPAAVERAVALLDEETFVDTRVIEHEIPMHSTRFREVGADFASTLRELPFAAPRLPYLPNVTARYEDHPTPAGFVELLSEHVCRPVRWRESVDRALARHPGAAILEVGPRSVLTHLLDRTWHREVLKLHTDAADDPEQHFAEVVETLHDDSTFEPRREEAA